MRQALLIIFFILCFVYSCKDNKQRENATKIVNEWIGKEIRFPDNVSCFFAGKDTIPELCSEQFKKEYKILLYVDSTGCSDCRLKLYEWKQLIEEADSLFHGKVGFLLFFQPKEIRDMTFMFSGSKFNNPVFIDKKGEINRLNRFRQEMQFQCFLLDSDNKVLMIGNPVLNHKIWELYKKQINREHYSKT